MSAVATKGEIKKLTAPPACVKTTTHLCCTKKILARLQTRLAQRTKVCLKIIFLRMKKSAILPAIRLPPPAPPRNVGKSHSVPLARSRVLLFNIARGGGGAVKKCIP